MEKKLELVLDRKISNVTSLELMKNVKKELSFQTNQFKLLYMEDLSRWST